MGSIEYKNPPECVDCAVGAAFDLVDGHGFVCALCLARDFNESQRLVLLNFLRRPCKLVDALHNNLVGHKVMEYVFGDGLPGCCQCGECHRIWFTHGWVCPMFFYRHELLALLDAQHGCKYCLPDWQDQLRLVLAAWTGAATTGQPSPTSA